MPDTTVPARARHHRTGRRAPAPRTLRRQLHRIAVLPALVTVPMLIIAIYLTRDPARQISHGWLIWSAVTSACAFASAVAWSMSASVADTLQHQANVDAQWAGQLRDGLPQAFKDIQACMDQVRRGEQPQIRALPDASPGPHPLAELACAWDAFVRDVQVLVANSSADRDRAALLVLGRRMLGLSNQALSGFDDLERNTEDPEVLRGLFFLDHKTTRMRRFAESLIILGGGAPQEPREPAALSLVLQHAIQEVEDYRRVEVIAPIDTTVRGRVTGALAHLLAELIDNGLNFSPPDHPVRVRLTQAPAGACVEIEDRGTSMPAATLEHLNQLLAGTARHTNEYVRDGRLGIWAVSELAQRYGLHVHLETNVYGAITAVVVIPAPQLHEGDASTRAHRTSASAPAKAPSATSVAPGAGDSSAGQMPAETTLALPVVHTAGPTAGSAQASPKAALPQRRAPRPPEHGHPAATGQAAARTPLPARDPSKSYRHPELLDQEQRPAPSRESAPDPGVVRAFAQGVDRAAPEPVATDPEADPANPHQHGGRA
ncbi:ATP-binding protein [Streptomyces sp. NPDC093510]|uniref:sensor histidine kinase n=1 Tax=Streptomyces sp. NPDC093510 TaxID=3155199 RepID=UPI003435317E